MLTENSSGFRGVQERWCWWEAFINRPSEQLIWKEDCLKIAERERKGDMKRGEERRGGGDLWPPDVILETARGGAF